MDTTAQPHRTASKPSFAELFTPKLVTVLREGYDLGKFRADVLAGLTVAIVALPLSMAIAIASGVTPERGLYTAAVGGFLVAALGGSRFQIGGPAAAFTVLVANTVAHHGLDGLLLAAMMAGIFLTVAGFLRLGTYVKFIPYPVTIGFIAGIAIILFASQIHDMLGLTLAGKEPADFLPKLGMLWNAKATVNIAAVGITVLTVALIVGIRKYRANWPGILIAIIVASLAVKLFGLPVETIGTRFGGIPGSLPLPALPPLSPEKALAVLPDAASFALLGAIESLLSAMVADGMTGRRHRSNMELVAQGVANFVSPLFGGICVTGTVARTATNVRAGATSPIASMAHALFVLLLMLVAAPLASYIPLAGLAGVLAVVCWNMADKHEVLTLLRTSRADAFVLIVTFGLTVFRGLTEAIVVGFALGALLFIYRMAQTTGIERHVPFVPEDEADDAEPRPPYDPGIATDPDVAVYRITGAFFFGAAATIGSVLDSIASQHKAFVIDFSAVPFIDSTGANAIATVARNAVRQGIVVLVSGTSPAVKRALTSHGVKAPLVDYETTLEKAFATARAAVAKQKAA